MSHTKVCKVSDCNGRARCKELCDKHWRRLELYGNPLGYSLAGSLAPRDEVFWSKVEKTDGCWWWLAGRSSTGYGVFADRGSCYAHRWAYAHLVGPIPDGLVIDHLCRNRLCVRPDHLEPVTIAENVLRGGGMARVYRTNICPRGHAITGENEYIRPNGGRMCRACCRLRESRRVRDQSRKPDHDGRLA